LLEPGDVMNTAARLEQSSALGQILVGRETLRLTGDVIEFGERRIVAAKGKRDPLPAWPVLRVRRVRRRLRSQLVGRGRELEVLAAALEQAIARRELRIVVVLGEPGIGKSRLAEEFFRRASGRAALLQAACPSYGEGSAWLPLAEIVRQETGIGGAAADERALGKLRDALAARHPADELPLIEAQLAALLGAPGLAVSSGHELLWAFRRYLVGLVSFAPAALVLDDLHWASDSLLETIQELVQTIGSVPLLLVLQGRPELRGRLSELLADERTRVISLAALSEAEAATLIDNLTEARGSGWADDVRQSIVARAGGSPLFLEEVATLAAEEGTAVGLPPSLRALIAARLDLLAEEVKAGAQAAAVIGNVFWDGAVASLYEKASSADTLRQLRTRGFVDEESESTFLGQRQFRFHHVLIREVTYESVPKRERAQLHRRAAAWLQERCGERPELIVPVAHHLERAVLLRREVAPLEALDPELIAAAAGALGEAGGWTAANAGIAEAIALLRSGVETAGGNLRLADVLEARLAALLAKAGAIDEAGRLAENALAAATRPETSALALLALAECQRSRGDFPGLRRSAERALEIARSGHLSTLEVELLGMVGFADFRAGRYVSAAEHYRRAAAVALELGDVAQAAWNTAFASVCPIWTGELAEAERMTAEALRLATQSGSLRALEHVQAALGHLRLVQDRLDESLAHGRERLRLANELGERLWIIASYALSLANPLHYLGKREDEWAMLEKAFAVSHELGGSFLDNDIHAARVGILIAWRRLEEAAEEAQLIPPAYPQVAELRAAQGRDDEAERIWRHVLEGYAGRDDRLNPAEAMAGYARFLATRGRTEEARAILANARPLVEGTGAKMCERLIQEADMLLHSGAV
jgi:predicted ATPase